MRSVLVWTVRLCAVAGWVATAVACTWLLGATAMARPWHGPLVWGAVAVGCAVVRVVALWVLRDEPRDALARSGGWTKLRTGAVWLLVAFASGSFFVALLTSPNSGEKLDSLRDAGAEVGTATVMERLSVRKELDDEGAVQGYVSRMVVSVADGADGADGVERLTVRGAYTYKKPREGTRVDVLWARSAPDLGGYVNESKDLTTLAAGRWAAFQDDELGDASLMAFVVIGLFGAVLGPVFTLVNDADDLQEMAWSAPAQTVFAVLAAAVYWGWRPLLLGQQPGLAEMLLAAGSFLLVLLVYLFMAAFRLR
ncbi:hypothetical protein ACFS5L_28670 [Streptomyces phyllanthi]|uniref:Uncharacterized protein n=1 Tax=Streptomyces phyllanthi TaxID=1803180 RepID=A0A5N8W7M2_9ACTN|nr:hypothetical protein [Streptomyces phyllanthi]MPY43481.1 hypothetical protein [Streptomyces phyllanthi]